MPRLRRWMMGSANLGDELLGENVERALGNHDAIEIVFADGARQGGEFNKIVARGGKETSLGNCAAPVSGASDALKGDGDGAWRRELDDEVDVADIDAEL